MSAQSRSPEPLALFADLVTLVAATSCPAGLDLLHLLFNEDAIDVSRPHVQHARYEFTWHCTVCKLHIVLAMCWTGLHQILAA